MSTLQLEPLEATFGARVHGIKLATLDEPTFRALYDAWLEHALLVLSDQYLTREEQIAFATRFGELEFDIAALSNVMKDGVEKPVSYGSRTLSVAERNYGHVEKEGLSLVYATRKFHQYLYGQRFTLVTDHKPLLGLFGENHGLPSRSSARVLRWALMLSAYDYRLEYRPGKDHGNADALSRLPLQLKPGEATTSVVTVTCLSKRGRCCV